MVPVKILDEVMSKNVLAQMLRYEAKEVTIDRRRGQLAAFRALIWRLSPTFPFVNLKPEAATTVSYHIPLFNYFSQSLFVNCSFLVWLRSAWVLRVELFPLIRFHHSLKLHHYHLHRQQRIHSFWLKLKNSCCFLASFLRLMMKTSQHNAIATR